MQSTMGVDISEPKEQVFEFYKKIYSEDYFDDIKPYNGAIEYPNVPKYDHSTFIQEEVVSNRGVASRSPYPEIWARYPQSKEEEDEWVIELMVKPQYWPEWKKKRGYTAEIRK
jgi:hypothetical protein